MKLFPSILLVVVLLSAEPSWTQDMPVPVNVQYPLFMKMLTFDRRLKARVGNEMVIGILYQGKFRKSRNVRDELIEVITASPIKTVETIPIRFVSIDLSTVTDLRGELSSSKVDALYITPVRAVEVREIAVIAQEKEITTFGSMPEYLKLGIALSVDVKGEKPLICINLAASKAEGAEFDSQLLNLARIVHGEE